PDNADYRVVLEPGETFLGTVNEDFAVESMAGEIFQLGNASWRILGINSGTVRVADAHGQPPGIPFWLGEAPGRTRELSAAVSGLRKEIERRIKERARVGSGAAVPDVCAGVSPATNAGARRPSGGRTPAPLPRSSWEARNLPNPNWSARTSRRGSGKSPAFPNPAR